MKGRVHAVPRDSQIEARPPCWPSGALLSKPSSILGAFLRIPTKGSGTSTRKELQLRNLLQATVLLLSDLELPGDPGTQTLTSILCKSTLGFTDSPKLVVLKVSSFRNCCCPCPPEDMGRTFSTVLLMGAKHWKQLRCPPTGKQINNL